MTFADKLYDAMVKARARHPEGNLSPAEWKKLTNELAAAHFKRRKPQSAIDRNRLLETLALATGTRDVNQVTPSGWKTLSRALKEISAGAGTLNDEQLIAEIKRRAVAYKIRHPTWDLTPSSLAKWWGHFAPPAGGETIAAGPENWIGWMRENCEGWVRFTDETRDSIAVPSWEKLGAPERATILDLMRKSGVSV